MNSRRFFISFCMLYAVTSCIWLAGCSSQSASNGRDAALLTTASATEITDPYVCQVADYQRTGIPVVLPRTAGKWELPYVGPVLARQGLLEPPAGIPQLQLPLDGTAKGRWISNAHRASVPGIPWGHPRPPHTGEARLLFLLSRYVSNSQQNRSADVETKMFGDNDGRVSPSLNAFYHEMSYGQLSITGECFPKSGSYLANTHAESDLGAYMLDVLNAYLGDGGSFSDFDGNNDGYIDGLVFILPGEIRSFVTHFYWDELEQYFGKKVISVCILGESDLDGECNTMHHEMGHIYYLPDYYDYGGDIHPANPGPDGNEGMGCGYWDLMCAGNFTNPPMPFSAFNKWILGWLQPNVITANTTGLTLQPANDIDKPDQVYLVWRDGEYTEDANPEYFLLENRWVDAICSDGGSGQIPQWKPGTGLLIWHIDEDVWNQRFDMNSDTGGPNSYEERKATDLECADAVAHDGYLSGWDQLDGDANTGNPGDSSDVWPYENREFGVGTVPGSISNSGTATDVRIFNIQKDVSSRTVTVDIELNTFQDPAPTIEISAPDGSSYLAGDVAVSVAVTGNLARVDYSVQYDGGTLTGSASSTPYGTVLDTTALGNQRVLLTATAVAIDGQTASDAMVIDLYNFRGDTNNDGVINELDLQPILLNIGTLPGGMDFRPWFDCDEDGIVSERDAAYLGYHYGEMPLL